MKHQVAITLILLLMVGVITSAFGGNERQRGDVEKLMEPSSLGQAAGKLNINIENPVNDYEVDESTEEIDLQDGKETVIDLSPAKGNLSSTESLPQMPLSFSEFGGTEEDGRKLLKKDSKSKKKNKKTAKSDKKSKTSSSDDSESEESQPTPQPTPQPQPLPDSTTAEIHVVTHEVIDNQGNNADTFWTTWKQGATLALAGRSNLQWHAVGYDADAATNALSVACSSGDAVVVTVPYASTTDEYQKMDDAINQCIAKGKPVITANTDTYHNENVYAFFGTSNYDMGVKCALSVLFPGDLDVAQGRKDAPRLSENRDDIQVYWDAASRQNEGLKQRLEGLQTTFARHFQKATIFEPSGRPDCPCAQEYPPGVHVNDGEGLRIRMPDTGEVFEYPPGYGLNACGEHDRNLAPSCDKAEPEPFCFSKWCYVDENNCDANFTRAGEYIWEDYPGEEYPYSYATCGENNVYLDFLDGTDSGGIGAVGLTGVGVQTIVLSSDWAPKFDPSNPNSNIFICGEESTDLIGIAQVGQSPFMQGLSATGAALAAAIALDNGTPWNAFKGNAASTSTSQVFHSAQQRTNPILTEPLSRYGKAIVEQLDEHYVTKGITWDIWHDAVFEDDWILQHPPPKYIGQPSRNLNVPQCCTLGQANNHQLLAPCDPNVTSQECNFDFGLFKCDTDDDCNVKEFFVKPDGAEGPYLEGDEMERCLRDRDCETKTYFNAGICEEISATRKEETGSAEKLCVSHSHDLYERIYNHIIQAEHLVEITSLDSFDLIGSWGLENNGNPFLSAVRNALTYLSTTGKKIIVKCHFGSIAGGALQSANENTQNITEQITRDMITPSEMTVWVGTYRYAFNSWNHGKIIAIDGKKLITGGSNYYQTHYLREDPIHDVSLQVSGGPAITAHRYSQRLWRTACDWWTFPGFNMVHYFVSISQRQPDGSIETNTFGGLNSCPEAINSLIEDDVLEDVPDDGNRPKTGKSVITAARLSSLGESVQGGSHTSDIAMLAMMDEAEESIKFSQQDMLPLIFGETVGTAAAVATSGYTFTGRVSAASFDDTWRIIGGIAKAIARGVDVYMMLSAPCAFGGDSIYYMQGPLPLGPINTGISAQYRCPVDGSPTNGWDYWEQAFTAQTNKGYSRWPHARDEDGEWGHILDGDAFNHRRKLTNEENDDHHVTQSVHRKLAYGYGWTLENVADWIFAYYMINEGSRPQIDGRSMTANEIAEHICTHAHIGHIRVTAEEDAYGSGGQIGNHAKIVMVDEKIFYIGSDNAYGSGLAEFGMITDDADITAEFNEKYWVPLWEQTKGTVSDPGLVSGSSSPTGTCKWRDNLEGRNAPWNDITHSWCRTFENGQDCLEAECIWVDKVVPHVQCSVSPHDTSCWMETDYCTGQLVQNGESCWEDTVCESQYCTWGLECQDKLQLGETCIEHDDCELGYCSIGFTCDGEQLENGENCFSDDACKSLRCNSLTWQCDDKLQDNENCALDDDCINDICNTFFQCGYQNDLEPCAFDSDCRGDFCNNAFTCGELPNGNICVWDTDCESDRCDNNIPPRCADKLPNGASCYLSNNCETGLCNNVLVCGKQPDGAGCITDNDCVSDNCNIQFSCGPLENGAVCATDSDCRSDRCNNLFYCSDKLDQGSWCWNDGDCSSNNCQSYWTGWYCTQPFDQKI